MDDTTTDFVRTVIAGQVRHVLTGAAASLITLGALQPEQSGAFVQIGVGAAMYALGAGWSWWQKDGQVLVAARLAKLRRHVDAIPLAAVTTIDVKHDTKVNDAILQAKDVADESLAAPGTK